MGYQVARSKDGFRQDLHDQEAPGEEAQSEQAASAVVQDEDGHQDPLQQVPPSLAPRQDRPVSSAQQPLLHEGAGTGLRSDTWTGALAGLPKRSWPLPTERKKK